MAERVASAHIEKPHIGDPRRIKVLPRAFRRTAYNIMKSLSTISLLRSALVLGVTVTAGVLTYAQSTAMPMSMGKKTMKTEMADRCQAMMAQHEKRAAETKAEDAALTAQVATMNNASEKQKPALLAAIVTRLVENTTASHARMSAMQAEMMPHMKEHMSAGVESMAACPMMKGMENKPADDRNAHHQKQK